MGALGLGAGLIAVTAIAGMSGKGNDLLNFGQNAINTLSNLLNSLLFKGEQFLQKSFGGSNPEQTEEQTQSDGQQEQTEEQTPAEQQEQMEEQTEMASDQPEYAEEAEFHDENETSGVGDKSIDAEEVEFSDQNGMKETDDISINAEEAEFKPDKVSGKAVQAVKENTEKDRLDNKVEDKEIEIGSGKRKSNPMEEVAEEAEFKPEKASYRYESNFSDSKDSSSINEGESGSKDSQGEISSDNLGLTKILKEQTVTEDFSAEQVAMAEASQVQQANGLLKNQVSQGIQNTVSKAGANHSAELSAEGQQNDISIGKRTVNADKMVIAGNDGKFDSVDQALYQASGMQKSGENIGKKAIEQAMEFART